MYLKNFYWKEYSYIYLHLFCSSRSRTFSISFLVPERCSFSHCSSSVLPTKNYLLRTMLNGRRLCLRNLVESIRVGSSLSKVIGSFFVIILLFQWWIWTSNCKHHIYCVFFNPLLLSPCSNRLLFFSPSEVIHFVCGLPILLLTIDIVVSSISLDERGMRFLFGTISHILMNYEH